MSFIEGIEVDGGQITLNYTLPLPLDNSRQEAVSVLGAYLILRLTLVHYGLSGLIDEGVYAVTSEKSHHTFLLY